jgi:cell wall-associated NlpC family hydrolase
LKDWSGDYVGLPWHLAGRDYAGVDCWGLLWLIYRDVLGISVASYVAETVDNPEREEIARMVNNEQSQQCWAPVANGDERQFDMIVIRRAGIESHIGVVVAPGRMLHVVEGHDVCVERFDAGRWAAKVAGIYRHRDVKL